MLNLKCGCDEVGRGSIIAEIYACAVILDPAYEIEGLRDSKKLTARKRELLAEEIKEHALDWSIAIASLEEIEELNVLHASLLAMKRAVEALKIKPKVVFVDGNHKPSIDILCKAIVKGDDLIKEISAASIIAKVARDKALLKYHELYPQYRFDKNKGYFTQEHQDAVEKYGLSPVHRKFYPALQKYLNPEKQISLF